MVAFLLTALLLFATPLYAAEDRTLLDMDVSRVASELLDKTTPEKLLRGLFDQALATIQEYVEVEGSLPSQESRRSGEFHLKLFPQGKSHSQEHVGAEGSFQPLSRRRSAGIHSSFQIFQAGPALRSPSRRYPLKNLLSVFSACT